MIELEIAECADVKNAEETEGILERSTRPAK